MLGRAAGLSPILAPGCVAPMSSELMRAAKGPSPQKAKVKKGALAPASSAGFFGQPSRSSSQPAPGRVVAGKGNATHSKAAGPPPKVMVRPNPNRGDVWPAERLVDAVKRKIVVNKGASSDSAGSRNTVTWVSTHGHCVVASADKYREPAQVQVTALFDGKLGVRLRMGGLMVTGFDVPEAAALGWQEGDEIVALNGNPVRNKEDFKRELTEARKELPMVFTVMRISSKPGTCCLDTE